MKIFFVSLGCDKNLVDSEMMIGMLAEKGHVITDDEKEAEVVVVNTCCFILDAKQESIETILQMAELKKDGKLEGFTPEGWTAPESEQREEFRLMYQHNLGEVYFYIEDSPP